MSAQGRSLLKLVKCVQHTLLFINRKDRSLNFRFFPLTKSTRDLYNITFLISIVPTYTYNSKKYDGKHGWKTQIIIHKKIKWTLILSDNELILSYYSYYYLKKKQQKKTEGRVWKDAEVEEGKVEKE